MSEPEFPSEMIERAARRAIQMKMGDETPLWVLLADLGRTVNDLKGPVRGALEESGHADLVAALKAARPMVALNAALVSRACKCTTCVSGREALAAIDAALRKAGAL